MTRKGRTILFIFLLILFLLAAFLTVCYSLGWRFDWGAKKIVQPGIFYLKVWPKSVQIYLDGKSKKKTDFFFGSALIENLLPKKYDIEIKKEGFHDWRKTLEIKERQVTEAKNIVLIPENPDFKIITKGVKDFFFSPDEKKIILKEEEVNSGKTIWSLKLFEIDKNVKSQLINERDISKKESVQLLGLKFSPDSKKILLELGLKENIIYYLLEIDKAPSILTPLDFLGPEVEEVYFNPKNPQKLLALLTPIKEESALASPDGKISEELSEIDLVNKKISPPLLKNVISCLILDNDIYYFDTLGFIYKTNFSFNPGDKLNIIPFPLKKETKYEITASNSHIFLEENDILYIFDEGKKSFQKIFEPVKNFKFSPDSKKLLYFNDYEIWILFLEKITDSPQKEAGDQLFLTRFSEKIDEVFWYTNHYFIFNTGGKIKIAEIDDRDKINIVDLTNLKEPKIFWNQNNKKLYLLSEENLYTSEKLVP